MKPASIVAALAAALPLWAANEPMPTAQQTALVQKYCAVCHHDAFKNGGLSLQHFDAAQPDPGVAAMLASKLKAQAIGAAGVAPPDKATQDALLVAMTAAAAGSGQWTVSRTADSAITAGVVKQTPSTASGGEPDLFRLTLACRADTREGEMQLAWSPGVPKQGRLMTVAVDGNAPFTYKVEGNEKMGNGTGTLSGPGAAILPVARLPKHTLTFKNLFADETVVFTFDDLAQPARQALSECFSREKRYVK